MNGTMEQAMIGNFARYYKPYKLTLYAVILGSLLAAGLDHSLGVDVAVGGVAEHPDGAIGDVELATWGDGDGAGVDQAGAVA